MKTKIKNIIKVISAFLTSDKMKTFYWQTADAFLALLIVEVSNIHVSYAPILFAGLSLLTKYVNKKYLQSKE